MDTSNYDVTTTFHGNGSITQQFTPKQSVLKPITLIDEIALNEAAWKFNDEWGVLMKQHPDIAKVLNKFKSGWLFNNIKQLIRPVIITYLENKK